MSIATVVTRGYGSFGSVNKLPTWGYDIGAAVLVQLNDGWIAESRVRVAVPDSRATVSIAASRDRVWIAKEKR